MKRKIQRRAETGRILLGQTEAPCRERAMRVMPSSNSFENTSIRRLRPAILLLPVCLAWSCASDETRLAQSDATAPLSPPDAGPSTPDATVTDASSDASSALELPSTPAGQELEWVLSVLNEQQGVVTVTAVEEHFHPSFLQALPLATVQTTFRQLARSLAPLQVVEIASSTDAELQVVVNTSDGLSRIRIALAPNGQIGGLLFSPYLEPPQSWVEVEAALNDIGPGSQFLAAEVSPEGECLTLHSLRPEQSLAIGSAFKLYVLSALGERIARDELSWDGTVVVDDALKSLPSGELQNAPAGTELSVQRTAELMISESDNTATDHLIALIGREAVEAQQTLAGHSAPEKNTPFLSTREAFLLKLFASEEEVASYVAADVEERRELLASLEEPTSVDPETLPDWTSPRLIEEVEWFASADDLCRVWAHLSGQWRQPGLEPMRSIVSMNPGLPLDDSVFPFVGFKGGSEPGVLTLSWLVTTTQGHNLVVSVSVNDTEKPFPAEPVLAVADGIFRLLALAAQ